VIDLSQIPEAVIRPVGRPPKLFTCNKCGAVIGSAAVRSHKCGKGIADAMAAQWG